MKNKQLWLTRALAGLVLTLLGMSESALAAGGYTYTLVRPFLPNGPSIPSTEILCDYALNDLNQVAYLTYQSQVGPSSTTNQLFVHFWDPNPTSATYGDKVIYTATDIVTNIGVTYSGTTPACGGVGGYAQEIAVNSAGQVSLEVVFPGPSGSFQDYGFVLLDAIKSTALVPVILATVPQPTTNVEIAGLGLSAAGTRSFYAVDSANTLLSDLGTVAANSVVTSAPFPWTPYPTTWNGSAGLEHPTPAINAPGQVSLLVRNSSTGAPTILDLAPAGTSVTATPYGDSTWSISGALALNTRGDAAFLTQAYTGGLFRVVVAPANRSLSPLVVTDGITMPNSSAARAISLSDSNEITFAAIDTSISLGVGLPSIWSVAAGGVPVGMFSAWDPAFFVYTLGQTIPTNLTVCGSSVVCSGNSANWINGGQTPPYNEVTANKFGVGLFYVILNQPSTATTGALVIAQPTAGLRPSFPAPPDNQDGTSGLMTFSAPCAAFYSRTSGPSGTGSFLTPALTFGPYTGPCYLDPPVASGYALTAAAGADNFQSVIIPAPLPGGQSAFTINYQTTTGPTSAPISAGQTYTFPSGGVPAFSITGINASEALSPTNTSAFELGLTWVNKGVLPTGLTMLPLVDTGPTITNSIAGTLGTNGWYTSDVTVTWTVTDTASPITSQTGCTTTVISTDTLGQTLTCSATSAGGTTTQSVTIKRDTVPPVVVGTLAPLANANGWNNTNVTAHFTGTDATSGFGSCTADQLLTTEAAGQMASGTCTDLAGNTSAVLTLSGINIDKTAPTVTASRSPLPGTGGWNNTPVTVSVTGTDSLSGVAANGCSAPVTLSTDGAGQMGSGSCTDRAGNSASASISGINIDRTPPTAKATTTPAPNTAGWNNTNVTVSFTGTDSLTGSGVASCTPNIVIGVEGAGVNASGTCTDVAGNVSAAATATLNIDKTAPTATISSPVNGASISAGTVIAASYSCSDNLSGVPATQCVGTVANGTPIDTTGSGVKTFTVVPTDLAGNTGAPAAASYTVTTGTGDTTPPVIQPVVTGTLGNNGWYTSKVTLTWLVTDPESAIKSINGCGATSVINDTIGKSFTCTATSGGGTSSVSVTIKKDANAPNIRIQVPREEESVYHLHQVVDASYSCSDAVSGVASCTGTVPSGSPLDTSTTGIKTLTVNAVDNAGNAKSASARYRVR